jgi:AcrR family transcriptional regulator
MPNRETHKEQRMVRRTKFAIVEAFNTLIERKPFEDISVVDIAREADVSKATFYRYFKDKYDVMNYNYKHMLDEAIDAPTITNYRDLYARLFSLGETKLRRISGALRSQGANSFESYIYAYSRSKVEEITRANRQGTGLSPAEDLQLDVFCYGISYMYKEWIKGHYDVTVDEAADKLFEMMPATLRAYWA